MISTATRDDFRQLADQINQVVGDLWRWHGNEFCPSETWTPAVNVYRFRRRLEICVDLAGVQSRHLDLRLEPGRLVIRGYRAAPDPRPAPEEMRLETMEIDHGPFCRTVPIDEQVDPARVETRYEGGWLWIRLPLREEG